MLIIFTKPQGKLLQTLADTVQHYIKYLAVHGFIVYCSWLRTITYGLELPFEAHILVCKLEFFVRTIPCDPSTATSKNAKNTPH